MNPLVTELHRQYQATLGMLHSVLDHCPDELWTQAPAGVDVWREAYHALFWLHTYLGGPEKRFHPHPFGRDVDPRLFTPPNATVTRDEALRYAAAAQAYADEVFGALTDERLRDPDGFDESDFRSVAHRLLYGLRHGQHHVGRLTVYLDQAGVDVDHWLG